MSRIQKWPIHNFEGRTYYRSVHSGVAYYRTNPANGSRYLHVDVWVSLNGPIPDGMEVHHKDRDGTNNDPTNLELLTSADHMREHIPVEAASAFGRLGGSARSDAKTAAARKNGAAPCAPGKKRGRPRNNPLQ